MKLFSLLSLFALVAAAPDGDSPLPPPQSSKDLVVPIPNSAFASLTSLPQNGLHFSSPLDDQLAVPANMCIQLIQVNAKLHGLNAQALKNAEKTYHTLVHRIHNPSKARFEAVKKAMVMTEHILSLLTEDDKKNLLNIMQRPYKTETVVKCSAFFKERIPALFKNP